MKNIIFILYLLPCFGMTQTPLAEDLPNLTYPYIIEELYIGHKNCEMMYIFEGKKGYGDILYFTKRGYPKLIKIPLPENLAKKKHLVFLFKSDTGVAFAEKKSSKYWFTFYLETMTWLSEKKIRGHDGEDRLD